VKSFTTDSFWRAYRSLPDGTRAQARKAYRLFRENPRHPSLQFKKVHPTEPIYSARITRDYRVVGIMEGDAIVWFWAGPHDEYLRIIRAR
jgi:mRNA-degrading endonuclease RelE of RelBE toxin-antitoxin system